MSQLWWKRKCLLYLSNRQSSTQPRSVPFQPEWCLRYFALWHWQTFSSDKKAWGSLGKLLFAQRKTYNSLNLDKWDVKYRYAHSNNLGSLFIIVLVSVWERKSYNSCSLQGKMQGEKTEVTKAQPTFKVMCLGMKWIQSRCWDCQRIKWIGIPRSLTSLDKVLICWNMKIDICYTFSRRHEL